MSALGVVDVVELVDLRLQLAEIRGDGLLVEVAEQCLVEPFVLPLRGRLVGFPGDRLDPESGDVLDELPDDSAAGRVQRGAVVRQESLRDAVAFDCFPDDADRVAGGLADGGGRRRRSGSGRR
ncbi:hypothetical protein JOE64_002581 [Microbacterium dextranolyticum]|nr:hypothetical protein [Microbacterium dextranolyticum]